MGHILRNVRNMKMDNKNEPAFPVVGMSQGAGQEFMGVFEYGLTKREWFIGAALQGLLANPIYAQKGFILDGKEYSLANAAILIANSTIEASKK